MHRQSRTHSATELLSNVRRARQLTERYAVGEVHPDDFMSRAPEQKADWDNLLDQIK
jgi:uncharacterized membrane protein